MITFKFDKTGSNKGVGMLFINDTEVGKTSIEKTLPYKLSFEGVDVGKDSKYPVSPAYANDGEFEFKGELVKVEYFLADDAEFITPKVN